jgi:nucleotide-binding universal stress UspA family protein
MLIPVDGSENALRAVKHAVFLAKNNAVIECELLNVQAPMEVRVRAYWSQEEVLKLQRAEAEQVLGPSRIILDAAAIRYNTTYLVGDVVQSIVAHAQATGCDGIIIGMRGMGIVVGPIAMGSVTSKVLHAAGVPVTVLK